MNGVLFRDIDGTIYFATALGDESTPTFEGPMLEVLNMDNTRPSCEVGNADGLKEANGIAYLPFAQILGFLEGIGGDIADALVRGEGP